MKYNPKIHKRKSIRLKGYDYSQKGLYYVTICCQNRTHFYGKIDKGEMQLNDAGKMIHKWYEELENKFPDIQCHEMIVMPNHFHCIIENVGGDGDAGVGTGVAVANGMMDGVANGMADGAANGAAAVGADLCVCPDINNDEISNEMNEMLGGHIGPPLHTNNNEIPGEMGEMGEMDETNETNETNEMNEMNEMGEMDETDETLGEPTLGEHIGSPLQGSPLHRVVQWFKTMSTNEYIRNVKSNNWKRFDGKLWQRNYWEHIIRNEKSYHRISKYIKSNPQNWDKDSLR